MSRELRYSVLIVDDDDSFRETLTRAFDRRGWEARSASGAVEALRLAAEESPEHAVIDLRMPDIDGIELLKRLLTLDPAIRILVLTGFGSIATAVDAMRAGAVNYLTKPADASEIVAALDSASAANPSPAAVPSLARVEWEHIQRVLHSCDGNVSVAARLLGLHRRTLQRKLGKNPAPR